MRYISYEREKMEGLKKIIKRFKAYLSVTTDKDKDNKPTKFKRVTKVKMSKKKKGGK
jgi:hypothetical protein